MSPFSLCHPGPCPQCPAFITKSCICGKTRYFTFESCFHPYLSLYLLTLCIYPKRSAPFICGFDTVILMELCVCSQPMRCGQGTVLQCDKVCGALLNCAKHPCTQVCHNGTCQPCPLQVQQGESHFVSSIQCSLRICPAVVFWSWQLGLIIN